MLELLLRTFFYLILEPLVFKVSFAVLYEFVQLPTIIQITAITSEQTAVVASVTGCATLILPTTVALAFTPSNNKCTTYSKLSGFNLRSTGNVYYLRMPGKCGACATSAEAKAALLNYVYGNTACPDTIFTYDDTSGYCYAPVAAQVNTSTSPYFSNYASYTQGAYRNGTLLVMSRGQASTALTYSCPFANSTVTTYNGVYYCYTIFTTSAPSTTYITQNVCNSWISGAGPIKFIHPGEPGYVSMRMGANAYTGIMYVSPNYVYYDGTSIPSYYAYWASGYPTGKTLVAMNNNLQLFDTTQSLMVRLMCRSSATAI